LCSAWSSSGIIAGSVPSTSLAAQPNMRSAAGFHSSTLRSVPNATIASAALATTCSATTRNIVPSKTSQVSERSHFISRTYWRDATPAALLSRVGSRAG
jgi:hypothetical protein